TMTWSPVSRCGVQVGLCLPRSSWAAREASRPSGTPAASITCQSRVISFAFGENVFCVILLLLSALASDQCWPRDGQAPGKHRSALLSRSIHSRWPYFPQDEPGALVAGYQRLLGTQRLSASARAGGRSGHP